MTPLFTRRAAGAPDADAVVYDRLDTVAEYAALHAAVAAASWPDIESELAALPIDEAAYALQLLADAPELAAFAETAQGESAWARVVLANHRIVEAWRIRTAASAEDVSPEQFAAFRDGIVAAERLLVEVCADDPGFAPAWGLRVLTARALEVAPSEARRRYDRAAALAPHALATQEHYLQYVTPKWFGSWELAETFVRDAVAAAPVGSPTGALEALLQIERWLALGGGDAGRAWLIEPSVAARLQDAAVRSVLAEGFLRTPLGIHAESMFAMAFWLSDQPRAAALLLERQGTRATEFPWSYVLDDAGGLSAVRAEVTEAAASAAEKGGRS